MRVKKLASTQQALGLRLIEKGETAKGRELLAKSTQILGNSPKATLGLLLSSLPLSWRQKIWHLFRQTRPQDYSEKVRTGS